MTSQENRITIHGPKARVRWSAGVRDGGWVGDGAAVVTDFNPSRAYFGAPPGTGKDTPGPAYEIELETSRLRVWVPLADVEAL